jgi:GTP cyclohydrolase I
VKKIWVALDPLLSVIESAVDHQVDLVITHHPLVFHPLTKIDLETSAGKVIGTAIRGNIAIYAAHTNLDSALEGINDLLAHQMGVHDLRPLVPCNFLSVKVNGDDAFPAPGLGRIGALRTPIAVDGLAQRIKACLGLEQVIVSGDMRLMVHRAAVCSGSGAGLLEAFLASDAQVYISGDLKYHNARSVEAAGRAMIDVGHFASEHIIIDVLVNKLQDAIHAAHWPVQVEACQIEQDPFRRI